VFDEMPLFFPKLNPSHVRTRYSFLLSFFVFSSNFVLKFCFLVWFLALSLQFASGPVHKMLVTKLGFWSFFNYN
jgi:hypothetical protein